jgi:hypothetical protein
MKAKIGPVWTAYEDLDKKLSQSNMDPSGKTLLEMSMLTRITCPQTAEQFFACGKNKGKNPYRCVPEAEKFFDCMYETSHKIVSVNAPMPRSSWDAYPKDVDRGVDKKQLLFYAGDVGRETVYLRANRPTALQDLQNHPSVIWKEIGGDLLP